MFTIFDISTVNRYCYYLCLVFRLNYAPLAALASLLRCANAISLNSIHLQLIHFVNFQVIFSVFFPFVILFLFNLFFAQACEHIWRPAQTTIKHAAWKQTQTLISAHKIANFAHTCM